MGKPVTGITPAQSTAARRAAAVAAGKCRECMVRDARSGRVTCEPCSIAAGIRRDRNRAGKSAEAKSLGAKTIAEISAERRAAAKAARLCSVCASNKARRGKLTCESCAIRSAKHAKSAK